MLCGGISGWKFMTPETPQPPTVRSTLLIFGVSGFLLLAAYRNWNAAAAVVTCGFLIAFTASELYVSGLRPSQIRFSTKSLLTFMTVAAVTMGLLTACVSAISNYFR